MDERNIHFDFDFTPIGQAIKKARESRGITREQLLVLSAMLPDIFKRLRMRGSIRVLSCLFNSLQCLMCQLMSIYSQTKKSKKVLSADA